MTRRLHAAIAAAGAIAALALTGCGGSDAGSLDSLEGKTFAAGVAKGQELVDGAPVSIEFLDGRISAHAGCNIINAPATWADGTLKLTAPAAMTQMFCDGLMDQEQWFVTFLESSPEIAFNGSRLTLTGGEIVLEMQQSEGRETGESAESAK